MESKRTKKSIVDSEKQKEDNEVFSKEKQDLRSRMNKKGKTTSLSKNSLYRRGNFYPFRW
jgi:hypothetical protein